MTKITKEQRTYFSYCQIVIDMYFVLSKEENLSKILF